MGNNLIYDVGLHRGEDTAYYLALGFDVVAFEADPDLVQYCRERFSREIEEGRLTIVAGAIADCGSPDPITFYRNAKTVWGTADSGWAERNSRLFRSSTPITVRRVDFADCLGRFGVPYYMKVDIEGADRLVIRSVCELADPPAYLSMESEKVDFDRLVSDIDLLKEAGYDRFKIVQQGVIPGSTSTVIDREGNRLAYRFEEHSSGPFGDQIASPWLTRDQAVDRYRPIFLRYRLLGDRSLVGRFGRIFTKPIERLFGVALPGWHDLHARRG